MKEKNCIISVRIKELLKEKNMSQVTLHALSGISQPTITNIMQGKHTPKDSTLQIIADTLGVYKEYLTGDIQYKNYDSWVKMNLLCDFTPEQTNAIIHLLDVFGYKVTAFDTDIMHIECPNGQNKKIGKHHLQSLLNNFFIMFDSLLLPEHV